MRFITPVWRAITAAFYGFWMLVVFLIIGIAIWGMITTPEGHQMALEIVLFPFVWLYDTVLGLASLAASLAYGAVILAAIGGVMYFFYSVFWRKPKMDQANGAATDDQRLPKYPN
jgi:hypothetical protein